MGLWGKLRKRKVKLIMVGIVLLSEALHIWHVSHHIDLTGDWMVTIGSKTSLETLELDMAKDNTLTGEFVTARGMIEPTQGTFWSGDVSLNVWKPKMAYYAWMVSSTQMKGNVHGNGKGTEPFVAIKVNTSQGGIKDWLARILNYLS